MHLTTDQKKILEFLRAVYPNDMDFDELVKRTGFPQSNVEEELVYLREKGMVETLGELGKRFIMAKITAIGIDALRQD